MTDMQFAGSAPFPGCGMMLDFPLEVSGRKFSGAGRLNGYGLIGK